MIVALLTLVGMRGVVAQEIPLPFSLEKDGYVTLVVETQDGRRVRNLIQETYFSAGNHTVYWDGYDEGVPVNRKRPDGNYQIDRALIEPGTYRLRALFHEGIDLVYEFSIQSPGSPPWRDRAGHGGWFSDHQTAWDVVHLPAGAVGYTDEPTLFFVSKTGEAGHGMMILDESGRKVYGKMSLPGSFRAGHQVARDIGPEADVMVVVYLATILENELSVYQFVRGQETIDPDPMRYTMASAYDLAIGGMAVYNQVVAVSLALEGKVAFFDMASRSLLGTVPVPDPRGLYVSPEQELYVVSGTRVLRYAADFDAATLTEEKVVVTGLEAGQGITLSSGELYVSDWGTSHQVKVYDLEGRLQRTIGQPGGPQIGLYDETRMALPRGIAVDSQGKLWVAERHYAPKRISRWTAATGAFDQAWYGPPKYGGGGMLDPEDRSRLYYTQNGRGNRMRLIEFELDWAAGTDRVKRILLDEEYYPTGDSIPYWAPEFARHVAGRQYMVNNNQNQQSGKVLVGIWLFENDRLRTVGAAGSVGDWEVMMALGEWSAYDKQPGRVFFVWSDLDGDEVVEAGEVQYEKMEKTMGTVFIEPDLSITSSWGYKVPAPVIRADGIPLYDLKAWYIHAPSWAGDEKDSFHLSRDSLQISFLGPFSFFSNGEQVAQYHSQWPNRNIGGGSVPVEEYSGQLTNTSRPLGDILIPSSGEAGPIWGVNGEYGQAWVLTWDGFFLTKLLEDRRTHEAWRYEEGTLRRGDPIGAVSGNTEMFWPTLNQTSDGEIYFIAGKEHSSILRVDGLETVRRLDFGLVEVTADMIGGGDEGTEGKGRKALASRIRTIAPVADGALLEWDRDDWGMVDEALGIEAAATVAAGSLYVALRTGMPDLLNNSGADGYALDFATGGGIDVWIGAAGADTARVDPVAGDLRVLITRVGSDPTNGPVRATLYQQVRPDARPDEGITYSSPIKTMHFDYVSEISGAVRLGQQGGDFEVSIALSALGLVPVDGMEMLGDVGVLKGDGMETTRRIYWNNKTKVMVSDVPTEAELTPRFWGIWTYKAAEEGVVEQQVVLESGWNTVALCVMPEDTDLEAVLAEVLPEVVLVRNGAGEIYYPAFGINNISTWNSLEGYDINVRQSATLVVSGLPMHPSDSVIPLRPGWNLVPYILTYPLPIEEALAGLGDNLMLAVDNLGQVYYPAYGINAIGSLQPGAGYSVYIREADNLRYPDAGTEGARTISLSAGGMRLPGGGK